MWDTEEIPASYEAEESPVSSERRITRPCPEPHSSFNTLLVCFFNTEFGAVEAELIGFGTIVLS
jgi:hypothetical protein